MSTPLIKFSAWISRPVRRRSGHWDDPIAVSPILTPAVLDELYKVISKSLAADMAFLRKPVRRRRFWSNLLKWVAWLLFSAGALTPILVVQNVQFAGERSGAGLALIAIVAGGLILLADQLFNLSRSWPRLMLSEQQIRNIIQVLAMEWQKRRPFVTDANAATEGVAMVELLAAALKDGHNVMLTQKQAWTSELDQAMTDLRGRFDTQRGSLEKTVQSQKEEAAKPARPANGAINVTIDKPGDLKGEVKLLIDGKEAGKWAAPTASLSVGDVAAGLRTVEVRCKRKAPPGEPFTSAQSVKVEPGAAAAFQVKV